MDKRERLRVRRDFLAVYRKGRAWTHRFLVLRVLSNGLSHNRYGFVVSKRLGNAVARNRLKRRLREGLRLVAVKPGWDVVLLARPPAAGRALDYREGEREKAGRLTPLSTVDTSLQQRPVVPAALRPTPA